MEWAAETTYPLIFPYRRSTKTTSFAWLKKQRTMSSRSNQYQETLDFLYRQLPMFQRIRPAALRKDLSISGRFVKPWPSRTTFSSLHIAGTNGKGRLRTCWLRYCRLPGWRVTFISRRITATSGNGSRSMANIFHAASGWSILWSDANR